MRRDVLLSRPQERRCRRVRVAALAIAAVLAADGAVAFERATDRDLISDLGDAIAGARHAAAQAIRPAGDDPVAAPGGSPGRRSSPSTAARDEAAGPGTPPGSSGAPPSTSTGHPAGGPAATSSKKAPPKQSSPGGEAVLSAAGSPTASPGPGVRLTAPGGTSTPSSGPAPATGTTPATAGPDDEAVSPDPAPAAEPLPEVVRRLGRFVEQTRSLEFKVPVQVRVLASAEFKAQYRRQLNLPSGQQAATKQGLLRALGIIGPGVDLARDLARLADGLMPPVFYDATTAEVVVQDGDIDPYEASMLVRALARALDDQWFGIDRPALGRALDPAADAFAGLVEGASRLVATGYEASLPAEEQAEIKAERTRRAGLVPTDIAPGLRTAYGLPAKAGPSLVAALVKAGGQARLNAAFASPPTTTEHLLVPHRYLAGEGARPVPAPVADGAVVGRGSLGHMGLLLMLAGVAPNDQVTQAARGWGGDQYVIWQNGPQTCVRATVHMDTPEDDTQLADVLGQWAAQRPGASIEGTGPVTVTRCA